MGRLLGSGDLKDGAVSFCFAQFNDVVWVENALLDNRFMIYRISHIQSNHKGIHNDISIEGT